MHAVHDKSERDSGEVVLSGGPSMKDHLAAISKDLAEAGVKSDISISYLDPKQAIVAACHAVPKSLVVMASLGATGVGKSRRGSVADHVIHHAPSPVVVVPPRGFLGPVLE